jgi:putative ABC transport system ATP-binding protein
LGFVFQAFHLISHLDIAQNVALPALLAGHSARDARAQAMQLLDRLGLGGRPRAFPGELSGGEQQRVALARAVVHRPRLILADEPTGNLDPRTAGLALQLLREIADSVGAAILMVTHSAPAAAQADRVLRLEPDRLLELNRTQGQWAP